MSEAAGSRTRRRPPVDYNPPAPQISNAKPKTKAKGRALKTAKENDKLITKEDDAHDDMEVDEAANGKRGRKPKRKVEQIEPEEEQVKSKTMESKLEFLETLGFDSKTAKRALAANDGDLEQTLDDFYAAKSAEKKQREPRLEGDEETEKPVKGKQGKAAKDKAKTKTKKEPKKNKKKMAPETEDAEDEEDENEMESEKEKVKKGELALKRNTPNISHTDKIPAKTKTPNKTPAVTPVSKQKSKNGNDLGAPKRNEEENDVDMAGNNNENENDNNNDDNDNDNENDDNRNNNNNNNNNNTGVEFESLLDGKNLDEMTVRDYYMAVHEQHCAMIREQTQKMVAALRAAHQQRKAHLLSLVSSTRNNNWVGNVGNVGNVGKLAVNVFVLVLPVNMVLKQ